MVDTLSEKLTSQFYAWEQRGRGWTLFDEPVELEPDFVPFFFHGIPSQASRVDDGRVPTVLSGLVDSVRSLFKSKAPTPPIEEEEYNIAAYGQEEHEGLHHIRIAFPLGTKMRTEEMEQVFLMFSNCTYPVSFEIAATSEKIVIQYACDITDALQVKHQLKAHFPNCVLTEQGDALFEMLQGEVCILDLGLKEEFMRPIAMQSGLDPDPFISLFGILENLTLGKGAGLQVLFQGCSNAWAESIVRSVSNQEGKAFFEDAPDMLPLAKQKISAPLFSVVLRAIGSGETEADAYSVAEHVANTLMIITRSNGNSLIPLLNDEYFQVTHLEDVLYRQSHRLGMILNSKELATVAHYPSASVVSAKLERETKKTKAVPASAHGHSFVLGKNLHQGIETPVSVSAGQRLKHTHIIGATGTGKSTLLLNMFLQDIEQKAGCCLLDPHGDLIEKVLAYIPEARMKDVLIIDPADADYPVGFNILSAHSELEKDILSSDLVAAFKRLSTSWGDQMNSVFANAILAFLENTKGGTLADLRRFLIEKSFRESILKTVTDPSIIYYWQREYPLLKSGSIGSILTRLDSFLRPKLIRNMVCQEKSIDFERLMNEQKIILVKLSQGLIGTENSFLLGTFIVSKLHQAALSRQATTQENRKDFFLYVDEFQHFITPSMSSILSGTRKYHLGLVLAHQSMQQIPDAEIASAIIANAGTRICFRLGETDARKLEDGFSYFDTKDLQNLSTGEAIARIEKPEFDFSMLTIPNIASAIPAEVQEQILTYSRQTYSTARLEVEAYLAESMQVPIQEEVKAVVQKQPPKIEQPEVIQQEVQQESPPAKVQEEVKPTQPQDISNAKVEKLVQMKEESLHRDLQRLIKEKAIKIGYKATIEAPTPDGTGFVDVLLERNGLRIACEVSVTTNAAWELHNVLKCIAAGYEQIVVCVKERKNIEKIRTGLINISEEKVTKVMVLDPDSLFIYLDEQLVKENVVETRIKGYRVMVEYGNITEQEAKEKQEAVTRVVVNSLKRKNKI